MSSRTKKYTTEEFIKKAKNKFGNKFDYSKTIYTGSSGKVIITCPIHGDFKITAKIHLSSVNGCPKCAIQHVAKAHEYNTEMFIQKSKKIFGELYDYSKTNYINSKEKVCITCKTCNRDFWKEPRVHLSDKLGCPYCQNSRFIDTDKFIKMAREIHGNKYDYSKSIYKSTRDKLIITCPIMDHGDFLQTPNKHISCQEGCPKCKSSVLELTIRMFLSKNQILFIEQKHWDWLVNIGPQAVDFYLPRYNIVIECLGRQHFEDSGYFGNLEEIKERDQNKLKLCKEHGINILYYSNLSTKNKPYSYPYKVYEDLDEILKIIKGESD